MERITRFRATAMLLFFATILGLFSVRMYAVQIMGGGNVVADSDTYTTYYTVKAARGEILDRNGNVMVGNRASYNLVFNNFVLTNADDPNGHLLRLVKMAMTSQYLIGTFEFGQDYCGKGIWGHLHRLLHALVIIYIYKGTFPIFKYTIITVTCLYIAFAFSRPDYFIAKVNLSSTDGNESVFFLGESFDDYEFMLELSADAAPAVAEWMEKQGYEYEIDNSYINEEYLFFYNPDEFGENYMCVISEETDDMGIRDFNVSRYIAKLLLP